MSKDTELEKMLKYIKTSKKVTKKEDVIKSSSMFTKENFKRGIILSEILGTPKGRKK